MSSITYGGTDLSNYGLIVTSEDSLAAANDIQTVQLLDRAFASAPRRQAHPVKIDYTIVGNSLADVMSKLDGVKAALLTGGGDKQLIFSIYSTRYWNARCSAVTASLKGFNASGSISLICADPCAYATTQTSHTSNINADPKTLTETPGGSACALPVWTLTAGATLAAATISVNNATTVEALTWTGAVSSGQALVIDAYHWTVTLAGTSSMATVSGSFPRLSPGVSNSITVSGFGTAGTLNIAYRDTFA